MPEAPLTKRLGRAAGRTVGDEIHRFFVQVPQHLQGEGGQPGFGVAHGGRAVAVHRAEVSLAIHQHVAHGEVLGHAGHALVDGRVAVGVVLPQHLAHDARALAVGLVGVEAHVVHGVEDATLDWLEAIAHVREGPGHDDAHGVVQVRLLHLPIDVHLSDRSHLHRPSSTRPRDLTPTPSPAAGAVCHPRIQERINEPAMPVERPHSLIRCPFGDGCLKGPHPSPVPSPSPAGERRDEVAENRLTARACRPSGPVV